MVDAVQDVGYEVGEVMRFGLNSLNERLRGAGIPLPRVPLMRLRRMDEPPVIADRPLTAVQKMMQPFRDEIVPSAVFGALPVVFNRAAAGDLVDRFPVRHNG